LDEDLTAEAFFVADFLVADLTEALVLVFLALVTFLVVLAFFAEVLTSEDKLPIKPNKSEKY